MKDEKLEKIFKKSEEILASGLSDFDKVKQLYFLTKEASRETWSIDKSYILRANDLYLYIQSLWNRIYYEKLNEEERSEINHLIFDEDRIDISFG